MLNGRWTPRVVGLQIGWGPAAEVDVGVLPRTPRTDLAPPGPAGSLGTR
ncbi:MAG: hypothetical protein AVDCRST_MAG20-853 [uncultured Acidimicrobiales bacterium]|uniref:Uncharacterized protein n=1 Tax=uncultured Acidimicrobiales bacterium TaxID=310071 RepID=A0A6J4HHJ0_9ACTN|nr:MAG: hypothetical protein AVDCRST_MAG20-853 [uncultured Acidimicrobiales bacterium]